MSNKNNVVITSGRRPAPTRWRPVLPSKQEGIHEIYEEGAVLLVGAALATVLLVTAAGTGTSAAQEHDDHDDDHHRARRPPPTTTMPPSTQHDLAAAARVADDDDPVRAVQRAGGADQPRRDPRPRPHGQPVPVLRPEAVHQLLHHRHDGRPGVRRRPAGGLEHRHAAPPHGAVQPGLGEDRRHRAARRSWASWASASSPPATSARPSSPPGYGYFVGWWDSWHMIWELANHNSAPQTTCSSR